MADQKPDLATLARDIAEIAESIRKHGPTRNPFTDEEIELIRRGAQIVEWFDTLGWLGKRLMAVIAAIVLLISQWERIVEWLGGAR